MRRRLESRLIIGLYAWCRQAERSIDRTLLSPQLWLPFTQYYDQRKRKGLCASLRELRAAAGELTFCPSREEIYDIHVSGKLCLFCDRVVNRFRSHWWFGEQELAFFRQTLDSFVKLLDEPERPFPGAVVAMRMDLYACQWAIKRRVGSIRALTKADRVENFLQPTFLRHFSLEELGLISAERQLGLPAA